MKICIGIILEHLGICPKDHQQLANDSYYSVRILMPDQGEFKPGVLYIGNEYQGNMHSEYTGAGVISSSQIDLPEGVTCYPYLYKIDPVVASNSLQELFDFYKDIDSRLNKALINNDGLQALLDIISEIIELPMWISSPDCKVLALADRPEISEKSAVWRMQKSIGQLPFFVAAGLVESNILMTYSSHSSNEILSSRYFHQYKYIVRTIRNSDSFYGLFYIVMAEKLNPFLYELVDDFVKILETACSKLYPKAPIGSLDQYSVIKFMLTDKKCDIQMVSTMISSWNWKISDSFCVFICKKDDQKDSDDSIYLMQTFEISLGGKSLIYDKYLVCVFQITNENTYKSISMNIREILYKSGKVGSFSNEFIGFHHLYENYIQALAALELGQRFKDKGPLFLYQEYYLLHVLSLCETSFNIKDLCHPAILELYLHDSAHGTAYLNTLKIYIQNERKLNQTADALFIHKNTLLYRINVIKKLINIDLDDFAIRDHLNLSFFIMRYFMGESKPE